MAWMKARRRIPKIDAAWAALLAAVATVALLVWPIAAYAEGLEGTPEVTRAQWIHELVEPFDGRVLVRGLEQVLKVKAPAYPFITI
jgi:hypothetical protein